MELLEKEWFIEAPWGRICLVAWGNCLDPPILLCHGENDSAASFRPLVSMLPKNFYYICMEMPGNGKSDRFPGEMMLSMFDMVYAIEVVRKHYRWETFTYMSHSVAGIIGRLYNLSYPGRMVKVIELDMITPRFGVKTDEFAAWYDRYFTQYYEKYNVYSAPRGTGPTYTWEQALEKLNKGRGLDAIKARATLERFSESAGYGLIRFTLDQRLKRLTAPPFSPEQMKTLFMSIKSHTLAVVTDNSIEKKRFEQFLLEDSPTYKVRKVVGTHDVHVIHPERVAPYVSQFLLYGLEGVEGKAKL